MPFVVPAEEKAELACTFAALILHDDNLKVDSDNIGKLLAAANVQIEPYWAKLYATMLANRKIGDLISAAAAPSGDAAPAAAAAGGGGSDAKADKKGDKKDAKADGKEKGGKEKGGDKGKKKEADAPAAAAADAGDGDDGPADMGFSLFD